MGDHEPVVEFFRNIDAGERDDCERACEAYARGVVTAIEAALDEP